MSLSSCVSKKKHRVIGSISQLNLGSCQCNQDGQAMHNDYCMPAVPDLTQCIAVEVPPLQSTFCQLVQNFRPLCCYPAQANLCYVMIIALLLQMHAPVSEKCLSKELAENTFAPSHETK